MDMTQQQIEDGVADVEKLRTHLDEMALTMDALRENVGQLSPETVGNCQVLGRDIQGLLQAGLDTANAFIAAMDIAAGDAPVEPPTPGPIDPTD